MSISQVYHVQSNETPYVHIVYSSSPLKTYICYNPFLNMFILNSSFKHRLRELVCFNTSANIQAILISMRLVLLHIVDDMTVNIFWFHINIEVCVYGQWMFLKNTSQAHFLSLSKKLFLHSSGWFNERVRGWVGGFTIDNKWNWRP